MLFRSPDRSAAFENLLHNDSEFYVSHIAPTPVETITMIKAAGGVAVIAHPFASRRGQTLRADSFADLVTVTGTDSTHDTTSGAVTVAGGMGIAGGLVVGGTLTATNLSISGAGFDVSLGTNGYQKLPTGLIIQWGQGTASGDNVPISFSTSFPTVCV